jgi:hypothetical protein
MTPIGTDFPCVIPTKNPTNQTDATGRDFGKSRTKSTSPDHSNGKHPSHNPLVAVRSRPAPPGGQTEEPYRELCQELFDLDTQYQREDSSRPTSQLEHTTSESGIETGGR